MKIGILDRYVGREFLLYFLATLGFFVGIFAVVDVFDKINRFLDAKAGMDVMLSYVSLSVPATVVLVMPMAMLLSSLLTLANFGKFNELTAMHVAGRSVARIARPMLVIGVLAAGLSFGLQEWVVPRANHARKQFWDRRILSIRDGGTQQRDNLLYLGSGGRVYSLKAYRVQEQRMLDPVIQTFRAGKLVERLDAREGLWKQDHWELREGIRRDFAGDREHAFKFGSMELRGVRERPDDFATEDQNPGFMTLTELGRYIRRLEESGRPSERYRVSWHFKLSYPWINFVALLLSIGIAGRLPRSTAALAFGLSAGAIFTFYGLVATAKALGESGVMWPLCAAWLGHAVFGILGAWLVWRSPR